MESIDSLNLTGTVSRDFALFFFVNDLPQASDNRIVVISNFFEKFAEIFLSQSQFATSVVVTPVANNGNTIRLLTS